MSAPAAAQRSGEDELEALIDATQSPRSALALAGRQSDDGDLIGAAATLERALIQSPNSRTLRVAYVALLCRLDDRERAAVELAKIDKGAADPTVQAACGTLAVIEVPRSEARIGLSGQISAGFVYTDDASGALKLQLDIPGVTYPRRDGVAFSGSSALAARLAVGHGAFVYGSMSGLIYANVSGPAYDYQIAGVAAGVGRVLGRVELSAGGLFDRASLRGSNYLTEAGGEAQIAVDLGSALRASLRGEIADQNFVDAPGLMRDGTRYDVAAQLQGGGRGNPAFSVGGGWERKTAETNYLGYHGYRMFGAVRVPFDGVYGTLAGTLRRIDYYNDPSTRDYVETRWFGRGGIGVPLGRGLAVEGAGTWTRRNYNSASALRDYRSFGGELRLVLNFGSHGESNR